MTNIHIGERMIDQTLMQATLEVLFNKNQVLPRLRELIHECKEDIESIREIGVPVPLAVDAIVQLMLHRRASPSVMIGILRKHCPDDLGFISQCLHKLVEHDFMDFDPVTKVFVTVIHIPSAIQAEFDRYQYPLPMLIPPRHLSKNDDSGYLDVPGSLILRDNHHEEDICLDHLNKLNSIRYSLNMQVAKAIPNQWKSLIKKKKAEESHDEYQKRLRQFETFNRVSLEIMDLLVKHDNIHHACHKYDSRGRTYVQGYHVNYMGNEWHKAVVEFADKEVCPI